MKKVLTLCIIRRGEHVLLGLKKRGFGAGRWNGFGGKVNPNEAITEATRREVTEEAGVVVHDLTPHGTLTFTFADQDDELEVHVFSTDAFTGEPTESDEMRPAWFPLTAIPYSGMWADDSHWLPLLLAGKQFQGTFHFQGTDTLLKHDVKEVAQS